MQLMFLELTEEFSQFMALVSIFVTFATIVAYGYFHKSTSIDSYSVHKPYRDTQNGFYLSSLRIVNQRTDDIRSWMTRTTKRMESPDDVPSHVLLVIFSKRENNLGGFQWKRKLHSFQVNLYLF
ncbi:hypothetical protein [Bacillus suaedaesalsae]|uniref:Uncharacterized protein n=1 Tax=Bacillus suaedaesalsae TaxID=2810349 RepID=A0ABS2DH89_9BACI|nr:hypothetical protein [Bacillus suaedaesalsae]MBM6617843.1 hypothetical protein [Bacillus suaedaesalsae]